MKDQNQIITDQELVDLQLTFIKEYMDENKGKTVEVPVNVLFLISQYLLSTRYYLDEGKYPISLEDNAFALEELLEKHYIAFRSKIGTECYQVHDLIYKAFHEERGNEGVNRLVNCQFPTGGDLK